MLQLLPLHMLCNRILPDFLDLQCTVYGLYRNTNFILFILLPIQYHPPLFEIKFNCKFELKLSECKLEEMLKVRNIPQCLCFTSPWVYYTSMYVVHKTLNKILSSGGNSNIFHNVLINKSKVF